MFEEEIQREKMIVELDMLSDPTDVTWIFGPPGIKLRISNSDADLVLNLGPEVIKQLKQALSWS